MQNVTDHLSISVLVVNDDQDTLTLLHQELAANGYRVAVASAGEQALECTRERRFDVILCDLQKSGMGGPQFTHAVTRMHPQIPVVLLTDRGDLKASRRAIEAGATDFFTKPMDLERLPFVLDGSIQKKQMEQQRLSADKTEVLFKTIKAVAAAIDAKSLWTDQHSARMAEFSLEIARECECSEDELNMLELAAHIHDVGKIGTPNRVLMKPSKLSDDEWVDVLQHPSLSASYLRDIPELCGVAAAVRHHHEHMDGSGYPDGLKGEAIPFSARILAVADAFEAMTSHRPYRDAMSWTDALSELKTNAGTQFDVEVVRAAERVLEAKYGEVDERQAA